MSQTLNAEVNCEAEPTQVAMQASIAIESLRSSGRQTGKLGRVGLPG